MLLIAMLVGCAEFTNYVDEGTACYDDGEVVVRFPACATQSCDSVVSATCTVTLVDGVMQVHGEARMKHQGLSCTEECISVTASCPAPAVDDPESVTLSYAGDEAPLDVCTGDAS